MWNTLTTNSALAVSSQGNLSNATQAADNFFFTSSFAPAFSLSEIKLYGLFTNSSASITDINVQLYQSYPFDSDPTRTPATVRANGPSDSQFATFDSSAGSLSYTTTDKGSFTVANTITAGSATQEGAVGPGLTGDLRLLDLQLTTPITLQPASGPGPGLLNHYWLAVTVNTSAGDYYWLAGTPPSVPADRQTWLHTNAFDPDWHRVSDIINNNNTNQNGTLTPAYSESFQLIGASVPEPAGITLLGTGMLGLLVWARRRRRTPAGIGG